MRGTSLSESQLVQMLEANPRISVHASPEIFGDHSELRSLAELGPLRRYTYGSQDQGKQDLEPIHVDGVALDLLKAIPALRQGQSITGIAWPLSQGNNPQDVTNLLAFPKLIHIRLVGEFATVQRIATLQQLPNLSSLELNLTRGDRWLYTNEVLDQIAKLSQLKNLTTDRLNSSVVQRLGKLKELRSLQSNDEAHTSLEAIGKAFPNLEHLRIAKWDDPKDQVFAKLEKLEVREIRKIDSLAKLPSLRTLILHRKIPQSLYDRYKKAFPNITIINGVGS